MIRTAAHIESILYKRQAQAGSRTVLCGVGGVKEICEQETDKLEGHGNHGVPQEAEEGTDGKALDEDFIAKSAGSENGGFPVWWCGVCGGLFICLI